MSHYIHFNILQALIFIGVVRGYIYFTRNCDDKENEVLVQYFGKGFNDCVNECRLIQMCKYIRYKQSLLHCSLLENDFVNVSSKTGPLCLYSDKRTWYSESNVCDINDCSANENCVEDENYINGYTCELVICLKPYGILNAFLMSSKYTLGSVLMYKCKPGFSGSGNNTIVCQENGTWSTSSFKCVKQCPRPRQQTDTAAMIKADIQNNFSPGTVVAYVCKAGFNSVNVFEAKSSFTCQTSGGWDMRGNIPCCLQEYYVFRDLCYMPYRVDTERHSSDIYRFCDNLGGDWVPIWHYTAVDIALRMENVIEILNEKNKTKFANEWNLERCLTEYYSNVSSGMKLSIIEIKELTFDEMVRHIKENKITNSGFTDCKGANPWAPGQPDGGDQEECVYSKMDEWGWYKWYDYDCALIEDRQAVFACGFSRDNIVV